MLTLTKKALNWALKHALKFGDSDVFPLPFEFHALQHDWTNVLGYLANQDVHVWTTRPPRSLLSPKARLGAYSGPIRTAIPIHFGH